MHKLLQQIELIRRFDQLLRFKSTGSPHELARKLSISEASLYRLIDTFREMGAHIEFNLDCQSYIYSDEVNFECGFFLKELSNQERGLTNGGFRNLSFLCSFESNNSHTICNLEWRTVSL